MNTRLPDLLHDLATEMPTETRTPVHRTLRRARTRRAAAVAFTGMTIVAVAFGTLAGLRALGSDPNARPIVPATDGPTAPAVPAPGDFQGLWPETDAEALAEAQNQVDDGHQPLRLDPAQTAVMLSTDLFGWNYDSVQPSVVERSAAFTLVELRSADLPAETPPISIGVSQLGRVGPGGIWSAITVTSPLIRGIAVGSGPDGTMEFTGELAGAGDGEVLRFEVLAGPGSLSTAEGSLALDGETFAGAWTIESTDPAPIVLWVHVVDAETGMTLGAVAMSVGSGAEPPVPSPTDLPTPTEALSPNFADLPPDVAVTAQRIYDGALARDFDALAELLDPNTFAYNFDDGSDPIPAWREDPSVLDLAAAILQLPAAEPREIEGYGTFYLWPYLIDSDFSALTEQERADLAFLGYSDEEIRLMIDGGYGYQGPRLGIDTDGLWRNFTTVGE